MEEKRNPGRPRKPELQASDLSEWVKADGESKITLNNEKATVEYAESMDWKRA